MADRPRWRDPILEWRLSEIERRIQQRFRIIMAESRMRRATFQRPRVSLQANDVTHQEESPAAANEQVYDEVHQDSSDLALPHPGTEADRTDVISELEKQIENEIIEDRLRNSDVVEWALSSRSARNIKVMAEQLVDILDPESQSASSPRNIRHTWFPHTNFIEQTTIYAIGGNLSLGVGPRWFSLRSPISQSNRSLNIETRTISTFPLRRLQTDRDESFRSTVDVAIGVSSDLAHEMLSFFVDAEAESGGLSSPVFDAFASPIMTASKCQEKGPCSICHEPFAVCDQPRVQLPCLHIFHRACAKRWMTTSTTCPLCRQDCRDNQRQESADGDE